MEVVEGMPGSSRPTLLVVRYGVELLVMDPQIMTKVSVSNKQMMEVISLLVGQNPMAEQKMSFSSRQIQWER